MEANKNNIVPHQYKVSRKMREKINGHHGAVIWVTGLSGSGKSTIAHHLDYELNKQNVHTYVLDGDNVRMGLTKDLSFTEKDRKENIRRIAEVSRLFADAGIIVVSSFISPFQEDRNFARSLILDGYFLEVFVQCSLKECERRDTKGLYKKAREGKIPNFTGISQKYEIPLNPEIIINSEKEPYTKSVVRIIDHLRERKIIIDK